MKIAMVSTSDWHGGAARAAWRLHRGLRLVGEDSLMVVKRKLSDDRHVFQVSPPRADFSRQESAFLEMEKKCIRRNRSPVSNASFSLPYPGYDLSRAAIMDGMDLVHLHYVRRFQSVESVARLLRTQRPVVWTLHDQSAFTGGCHYSADCDRYQEDCRDCPQLRDHSLQLPARVLMNKRKNWIPGPNAIVVAPSRWLAGCAGESAVFRGFEIACIANALDTDVFRPFPKPQAKKTLGLDPASVAILVGALNLKVKRKGFAVFLETIRLLRQDAAFSTDLAKGSVRLLSFGKTDDNRERQDLPIRSFGRVATDGELALIYSAADLFVLPSLEDNLPNNMLEALACGTPVIAFRVGGIPDAVIHGVTGLLVPERDVGRMGAAILDLARDRAARESMGRQGAELMKAKFNLRVQAQKYLELYRRLQARGAGAVSPESSLPGRSDDDPGGSEIDPDMYAGLRTAFQEFGISPRSRTRP